MATFRYKARDARGELTTGLMRAVSVAEAGAMLRNESKFVVNLDEVDEQKEQAAQNKARRKSGRIKRDDVIAFAHQLAAMIDTGVPLSEALECIAQQCANAAFAEVLEEVHGHVQSGGELSTALKQHPKIFPPVMTSLVAASEASGTMGMMLERVSGYLTKERQTAKKIKNALTYPAIMLVMITGVTVGLLVFVLPKFTTIFAQRGAALPLPTQALIVISEALTGYWWAWLLGIFGAVVGYVVASRTESGRRTIDQFKLKCPVLGELFRKLYLTRSMRTMGTMIDAGVPILDMVTIVRDVTSNRWYEDLWDDLSDRMQRGSQLSDGLFESPLIPRSISQMVYAGEKSGRLGVTMNKIAEFTEAEFDDQVKTTTSLIEPAMTASMGIIIGFIAIALLLPIFTVGNVVAS
ncbi:MAG: type II secretion system F family protein [Planctomycetota bacterium]